MVAAGMEVGLVELAREWKMRRSGGDAVSWLVGLCEEVMAAGLFGNAEGTRR